MVPTISRDRQDLVPVFAVFGGDELEGKFTSSGK
jgi:hypothetical protein